VSHLPGLAAWTPAVLAPRRQDAGVDMREAHGPQGVTQPASRALVLDAPDSLPPAIANSILERGKA